MNIRIITLPALLIFGILHISPELFSQIDTIHWSSDRPLTWDDFQGNPDESDDLSALTHTELQGTGFMKEGLPYYEIIVVFDKTYSWTKGSDNVGLLHHEQVHFNITELFARLIRKKIKELRKENIRSPELYQEMIQEISIQWKARQKEYDEDTDHGRNPEKQKEWEERIKIELKKLADYSYSKF